MPHYVPGLAPEQRSHEAARLLGQLRLVSNFKDTGKHLAAGPARLAEAAFPLGCSSCGRLEAGAVDDVERSEASRRPPSCGPTRT